MQLEDSSSADTVAVPLPRVAGFIRQVTHDVRNGLNSMDLQAAYLAELISDPEAGDELKRLRQLIQTTARQLQSISSNFWTTAPNPIPYSAAILVEDWRDRLSKEFPEKAGRIQWSIEVKEEWISVDIEMLFGALHRIFENAFNFADPGVLLAVRAYSDQTHFHLELSEPKTAVPVNPSGWGEEPFVSTRRGGYGLGLFRARAFLAVQGGELHIVHDSGRALLLVRVSLPLAPPE